MNLDKKNFFLALNKRFIFENNPFIAVAFFLIDLVLGRQHEHVSEPRIDSFISYVRHGNSNQRLNRNRSCQNRSRYALGRKRTKKNWTGRVGIIHSITLDRRFSRLSRVSFTLRGKEYVDRWYCYNTTFHYLCPSNVSNN